jgi:hypothetical protein
MSGDRRDYEVSEIRRRWVLDDGLSFDRYELVAYELVRGLRAGVELVVPLAPSDMSEVDWPQIGDVITAPDPLRPPQSSTEETDSDA